MRTVNRSIREIEAEIESGNLSEARRLLQDFSDFDPATRNGILIKLGTAPDRISYPLFVFLMEQIDLDERTRDRISNLIRMKSSTNPELLMDCVLNKSLKHRIRFIRIASEVRSPNLVAVLIEILAVESDILILKEVLKALSFVGSSESSRAIADFIYYGNEELKQEAIFALAEIGGSDAVAYLAQAVQGNSKTDLLVIDAIAEIKDDRATEELCELMASDSVDLRNRAIDRLEEIGMRAVPSILAHLESKNDDIAVHALTLLGRIGDTSTIPRIRRVLRRTNANIRFAAYEALEKLPSPGAAFSLATGLEDPVEQVRMAAAKAIDGLVSPMLVTGLKNMISSRDEQAKTVITTIIDAGAENVFQHLLDDDFFVDHAVDYLTRNAHPEIRDRFHRLITASGRKDSASKIQQAKRSEPEKSGVRIYVVDDSRMMLRLYKKKLHKMGYDPALFEFPAEVLKAVENRKPDLLISDLNMPEINGVQLTETIRKRWSPEELPILIITTQSDFAGQKSEKSHLVIDEESMGRAGVNMVIHKPFEDKDLSERIGRLLQFS